jgi:hypothetical protein
MASWNDQKASFEQRANLLTSQTTDQKITDLVTTMNRGIAAYTAPGGIQPRGATSDPDYESATKTFQTLSGLQKQYTALNKDISSFISYSSNNRDVQNKLAKVGELKGSIAKLEKALEEAKQDESVSKSRQDSVEHTRGNISMYQGFGHYIGLTRPIHTYSIPFLIGFGIIFLFFSGLLLKEFFAAPPDSYNTGSGTESVFSFFTDSRFYSALGGIVFVFTVVSILAATGRLGKRV